MKTLAECNEAELGDAMVRWGFKRSHAGRVLRSYWAGAGAVDWEAWRAPRALRERVSGEYGVYSSTVVERQMAEDGTTKLLLALRDGKRVETVLMGDFSEDRATGCLSTQAGCAMGCDFCATAQGGLERNLSAGEIVEQFLRLRGEARGVGRELRRVVLMGMGEPMHNYEAVMEAVRCMGGNALGGLGWRQITISTVGIVPGIERLTTEGLRLNLAVSLHAPDDATRAMLLPAGRRFGITEIMAAVDRHQAATGLPAIIQYCLLKDVNDAPEQAEMLAGLLAGRRMHVNLLHYNATGAGLSGRRYEASPLERTEAFIEVLRKHRVIAHFRRPRGREIAAACGQLKVEKSGNREIEKSENY
jgi:23S rRNA (adenine2503-C2)-methyltransferase